MSQEMEINTTNPASNSFIYTIDEINHGISSHFM